MIEKKDKHFDDKAKPVQKSQYDRIRMMRNWLYGLFSLVLIMTDFFRSSWLFQEALGTWIPQSEGNLPLYSRPKLGPNVAKSIDIVLESTFKKKAAPNLRKIFSGRIYDTDYEYYKKFQPHEEWSKDDNFATFKEYTHNENGTLLPGISSNNISYNSINYWEGFQVGYRGNKKTTTNIVLDAMFFQSVATNLSDQYAPILHYAGGQFWDLGDAHGSGNVEIYHMDFYEIDSKIYSNTSGIAGLLLESNVFIEIYPIHYVADVVRLVAFVLSVYLSFRYFRLIKSPQSYDEVVCCPYDLVMGNRIVAGLMGIAFLLDYEASINIIFVTGWYAFFTWKFYYVYLTLVYAFRCFWFLNFIATIHGVFAGLLYKAWFASAPISLRNGSISIIYGVGSLTASVCAAYLHHTSILSPYFEELSVVSFKGFHKETEKAGFDILSYDLTNGQYCICFLLLSNFLASVCVRGTKLLLGKHRGGGIVEENAFLQDLFKMGLLTTVPTGINNIRCMHSSSVSNFNSHPHLCGFRATEANVMRTSEAIVLLCSLQNNKHKVQIGFS